MPETRSTAKKGPLKKGRGRKAVQSAAKALARRPLSPTSDSDDTTILSNINVAPSSGSDLRDDQGNQVAERGSLPKLQGSRAQTRVTAPLRSLDTHNAPPSFMESISVEMPDFSKLDLNDKQDQAEPHSPIREDYEDMDLVNAPQSTPPGQYSRGYNSDDTERGVDRQHHNGGSRANATNDPRTTVIPNHQPCVRHCTREVAACLFRQAPPSATVRNTVLARLDRLVDCEQASAVELGYVMHPITKICVDLVAYLENDRYARVQRGGEDPLEVDEAIVWAKWAAKAATTGIFHERTSRCGSIAEQVEDWVSN